MGVMIQNPNMGFCLNARETEKVKCAETNKYKSKPGPCVGGLRVALFERCFWVFSTCKGNLNHRGEYNEIYNLDIEADLCNVAVRI